MAQTVIRGTQILNNTVQRQDLDTSTVGQAVATKLIQGSGITLSSTGADAGTGDVTVSAPVPSSPVILGETAADAFFTSGIPVPRYKGHPDGIWTYGTFDDHFDSPSSGTPNAKWVQTFDAAAVPAVYTQAASKLCIGATSPANTATLYNNRVTQTLPVQTNHTISLQVLLHAIAWAPLSGASAVLNLNLAYGANAGGVQVQVFALNGATFKAPQLYINSGAAYGTVVGNYLLTGVPPYWQFVYNTTNTTVNVSFDGITWFTLATIAAASSGFGSNAPAQFSMGVQVNFFSAAFAQLDWIKHV